MIPMTIKNSLGFIGLLFGLVGQIPSVAWSASPAVNTRSAMVMNASAGRTLFEHNADAQIPPASVTKVLTLYLVFEAIHEGHARFSDRVVISEKAAGTGGSRMHLQAGTEVPLEELIKGMAVDSGNDACVAAAEHMAGSEAAFVAQMNRKARELGMTNSHFINPHGLPAKGQVTTARDMAMLSLAYLRRFPESLRFHSMQSYTYNGVTQHNRNRLLGYCPGVDGLKTGWIAASGYNLLATAKRGDTRVLVVVLGAPNPTARLVETRKLLEVAYQKLAAGSPVIELADLSCYVDPYGPPPGKKQPHGKPKKIATAKKSQHQAGKKSATSTGKTKMAKNKSQRPAQTVVAKQDKAHQTGNQSSKGKPTKAKQQASVKQTTGKQQPAQGAKDKPAQTAKLSTKASNSAKSTASSCAPKNVKKTDSHQTAAKPQKTNGKSRDKTADSPKKAKPQAKKSPSENT